MKRCITAIFISFLCCFSFSCFSAEEIKLTNSKYGALVVRSVNGHSYINAYNMGNIYVGVDSVKAIFWMDSNDPITAKYFVVSAERNSPTCPIRYFIIDARGDVPIFSAPFTSCGYDSLPIVSLEKDGNILMTFAENTELSLKKQVWIYKNGVITEN